MLPAKRENNKAAFGVDGLTAEPGSWWRLADPDHECAGLHWSKGCAAPEHGIILLAREVRVIDGEIHTVVLTAHPMWRSSNDVRLLADDFFKAFVPAPDGAELRAKELNALMGHISQIGNSMAVIPDDEVLLSSDLDVSAPEDGVMAGLPDAGDAKVPDALLPGRDVISAQERLKTEIDIMMRRKAWMQERQDEMTAGWSIVTRYQNETAAAMLAGISAKTEMAQKALKNIQTLGLWLGDGVTVEKLVSGKSADPEAPLHLMQRMLYLDEEITVENMVGTGFSCDDMSEIGEILKNNPGLVDRMLPHDRCVVITRVRRNARKFSYPDNLSALFRILDQQDRDRRIHILARDGENVTMITADEATSRAERLFPSRKEIDEIFQERQGYDFKRHEYRKRTITPQDIEYSDKRSEHDNRALFYRRFLLILWGAHSRENIFGPFIGENCNWLEEMNSSDRFVFIHDEENVLEDGRPDVLDWLRAANRHIAPGSSVLVQGDLAIDEDTMPTAYHEPSAFKDPERKHEPENDFDLVVASKMKNLVVATLPCWKYNSHYKRVSTKRKLILRDDADVAISNGALCLDEIRSEDLLYYINSRNHRQNYLEWLYLFRQALSIVQARECEEDMHLTRMLHAGLINEDDRDLARRLVRLQLRSSRSDITVSTYERLGSVIRKIREGIPGAVPDVRVASIDLRGNWYLAVEEPDLAGLPFRLPILREYQVKRDRIAGETLVSNTFQRPGGRLVVHDARDPEDMHELWKSAPAGLRHLSDWQALMDMDPADVSGFLEDPTRDELIEIFDSSLHDSHKSTSRLVLTRYPQQVLGAIVAPLARSGAAGAFGLVATMDPYVAAVRTGNEDLVKDFVYRAYKYPEENLSRIMDYVAKQDDALTLSVARLGKKLGYADLAAEKFTHGPRSAVEKSDIRINGSGNESRRIERDTLEDICLWHGYHCGVTEDLGKTILEGRPLVKRLTCPQADAFIASKGF